MHKKLLSALLVSLASAPAQAAVQVYDWSFAPFDVQEGGSSGNRLAGTLRVDDADGDGRFTQSELLSLVIDGTEYAHCPPVNSGPCGFQGFSYAPATGLNFRLHSREELGESIYNMTVVTGDFWSRSAFYPEGAPYISLSVWTEQTRLTLSPVPEPHTYLMLGLGLLATFGGSAGQYLRRPRAMSIGRLTG